MPIGKWCGRIWRRPLTSECWWVYLLRCGDNSLYCGVTRDVMRRLAAHRQGRGARYTRGRQPLSLVWVEAAASRSAALRREREIKQWSRSRKEALARSWTDDGHKAATSIS